jgi:hypothetical protein
MGYEWLGVCLNLRGDVEDIRELLPFSGGGSGDPLEVNLAIAMYSGLDYLKSFCKIGCANL